MGALVGHCGLMMAAALPTDPLWASVKSLINFEAGMTDAKDGVAWSTDLGGPAIESAAGWSGEPALRLHDATQDRIARALSVPSNAPLTLEAWLYIYSGTIAGYFNGIFAVNDGIGNQRGVSHTNASGMNVDLSVIVNGNQGSTGAPVPILQPVHVALEHDGAGVWRYYVAGVLVNTQNVGAINVAQVYIGHSNTSWTDTSNMEIRAFRATQATRYGGNFTPPPMPWPTA